MADNPEKQSRWLRLSLRLSVRALMVLVLLIAGALGWIVNAAHRQRDTVAALRAAGATVFYDLPTVDNPASTRYERWQGWLADRLGPDFVVNVDKVWSSSVDSEDKLFNQIHTADQANRLASLIGGLRRVNYLDFHNCPAMGDAGLAGLEGLKVGVELDLRGSGVRGPGLRYLRKMNTLLVLDLTDLPLSDADVAPLSGMSSLAVLELEGTRVTDAGLEHLKGLTNLHTLLLSRTAVTGTGLTHLRGLKNLTNLALDSTETSCLDGLESLDALVSLTLRGTRVDDSDLSRLAGLVKMRNLDLKGTPVGDPGVARLSRLTNLESLGLEGTHVTDAGLAHLASMPKLFYLSLKHTTVTDACLEHLTAMKGLWLLFLEGTAVTDAKLAEFMRAMPSLKRVHNSSWRDDVYHYSTWRPGPAVDR